MSSAPRPRCIGIPMILRQRAAWGTCLGQFSINYFLYFLLTWLPSYLNRGRHFTLQQVGIYGGLLFLMSAIAAMSWGKLADRWIKAGATATQARIAPMVVGHVTIGICLVLTVLAHGPLFILMLALTGISLGISCCSSWAVTQTLAGPHASGRWTGVQNFIGNMAGWVAPALTGFLLDRTGSFFWPFFITAIVAWIGGVAWGGIVGRLVPVDWEHIDRESALISKPTAPALP
jgi:MFS family permease